MRNSSRWWTVCGLLGLSVLLAGQDGGGCGASPATNDNNDESDDDGALAPLVTERGACALWVGTLSGTRDWVQARQYQCPWLSGGSDSTDRHENESHAFDFDLMFHDAWYIDNQSSCAPTGNAARAISAMGAVQYERHWSERYDYGDVCGRYHEDTVDETFNFDVKAEDVQMWIEVDAATASEQDAILAERPCRQDYPVRIQIQVSPPATGGSGSYYSTSTSKGCDSDPQTTDDERTVTENSAASYTVVLYGTYHIAQDGRDTIEAASVPGDAEQSGECDGVNTDCTSNCTQTLTDDYTLSLARFPEGDRDMDGDCDSVDPCPDAAYEEQCAQ